MKRKLINAWAIISVPIIIFLLLFIYVILTEDISSTDNLSESRAKEVNNLDNQSDDNSNDSSEKKQVIINNVDISSKIEVKEIDSIIYANAGSFVESLTSADMSPTMRYFNYELIKDKDKVKYYLTEYYDGEEHLDDKYSHLLDLDAIIVSSWATESALFMLFIDSTDVVKFGEERNSILSIDEAPKIIDDAVYIPIEAFIKMIDFDFEIEIN